MNQRAIIGVLFGLIAIGGLGLALLIQQRYFGSTPPAPSPVAMPSANPLPTSSAALQSNVSAVLTLPPASSRALLNKPGFPVVYRGVVVAVDGQGQVISLHPVSAAGQIIEGQIFTVALPACSGAATLGLNGDEVASGTPANFVRFQNTVAVGKTMMFECDSGNFDLTTLSCTRFNSCATFKTCKGCSQ